MMGCLLVDCESGIGVVGADRELREFLRRVRTNGRVTVMSIAQHQHGTQNGRLEHTISLFMHRRFLVS
jgi:hypothetical protein